MKTYREVQTQTEVSDQLHDSAVYPHVKSSRYPLVRGLGEPKSWSKHSSERKDLVLAGIRTSTVQHTTRHYTH